MKNTSKIYTPILLALACAAGIFLGTKLNFSSSSKGLFSSNPRKEKLNKLIDYIDYEYVDDVNSDSIVDLTVNKILENLDPHSIYIPKGEYARVSENMQGDFVGIGVSFYNINDTVVVIQALEGGPSEKIGIKGGDRILYANGEPIFGRNIGNDSLTHFLKGEEGTHVNLKVERKGEKKLLDFKVVRARVPLKSINAAYMLTSKLGYIKINRFAETTYKEFQQALKKLEAEGATEIALDLRDNPGGYLSEAINITDEFLGDEKLILYTKNKSGAIERTYAQRKGDFENGKIYVLINEKSASASEVVAGALQDNDVGTIIGRRSYGKGLVQREMELGDGSAVRLTIARYYTPTGRSIQKPYENGNESYFKDYMHRYENGELKNVDSIQIDDSLQYKTPEGKLVYGGGGIIPDVFVGRDTNRHMENIILMQQSGVMSRFVFDQLEKNRAYYSQLKEEKFNTEVEIEDKMVQDFLRYIRNENINPEAYPYKNTLKRYLKATIAQQLYGTDAFAKLINEEDKIIEKLIELSHKK